MAKTQLDYRDDDTDLKGILIRESAAGLRPGIVLFPDARGIGDHAVQCSQSLAATGFVVLVADLYGGGLTAHSMDHAGHLMSDLRSDVARWRGRAGAALRALSQQASVDPERIAAIGYCFGGTTALELARSGAPLAAVVSFHGGLASPRPQDASRIKARVLVCHGASDKLVPSAQVAAFENEMMKTSVDWQLHSFGGAVHAFTNPAADAAGAPELAYNEPADRRSWAAMLDLFDEVFGPRGP